MHAIYNSIFINEINKEMHSFLFNHAFFERKSTLARQETEDIEETGQRWESGPSGNAACILTG